MTRAIFFFIWTVGEKIDKVSLDHQVTQSYTGPIRSKIKFAALSVDLQC
jgi:hypothetical protein